MRFLLSVAMIVTSTGLLCHGVFKDDEALAELKKSSDEKGLQRISREWPYSDAAVQARGKLVERWVTEKKVPEGASFFESAAGRIQGGFAEKIPFVDPFAAGAIGLMGLLLAVFMPGTRFRGLACLLLLGGVLAAGPAYMEPGRQIQIVDSFEPTKQALAQFPRVAIGTLFLAGLVLGPKRGPKGD